MRFSLLFLSVFLIITSIQAQDMMRFPDATSVPDAALPQCLRKASMLYENAPTIKDAPMLRQHGRDLLELGQRDYAKDIFERLVVLNKEAYGKKDERYVRALADLASAYVLLIRYQEAAGLFEEALPSAKALKGANSKFYLYVLSEAGFCHSRTQNWSKAFRYYRDAQKVVEQLGFKQSAEQVVVLNNLAACYQNLNQQKEAAQLYEQAYKAAKNKPKLALHVASNYGSLLIDLGQTEQAIALVNNNISNVERYWPATSMSTARIWTQYALIYMKLGRLDEAEGCLQKGFVANSLVFDEVTNIPNQAEDLMHNNQYLAVCTQAGLMMYSIELYKIKHQMTQELAALEEGYKIVQSMTRFGEKMMGSYLSEANKLILFRLGASVLFDRSLHYAYQLHQATKDKKYLKDAFFYSERSKSTLLTHALRSKDQQTLVELPEEVIQQQKDYIKQFKNLQKLKIEAPTLADRNKVQQALNELNVKIERYKADIKREYPDYYQYRYDEKLTDLAAVQAFLKERNKAMIEYALGLEHNYAFLVTGTTIRMIKLKFDPHEFTEQTKQLRQALTDYEFVVNQKQQSKSAYEQAARYFYETFAKELVELIPTKQSLVIVPDQQLGHLPFEAFLTKAPNSKSDWADMPYLIKRNPISYSYSATILLNQSQRREQRVVPEKGVLAFAASYPAIEPNSFSHQRGGNLGVLREGLSPLPGAEQEVGLLQEHLWGAFFEGNGANETNFKAEASKYSIIHLAMHGILNDNYPILSSLVFTEDSSQVEDNFLRAYEIAQMDLNADLVVLSACETGYGKFQQGEGVMSLAHSFAYAGASAVLMSLWQVNDLSTTAIMKDYYINLACVKTKDVALQTAKLEYMEAQEGSILSHPAFWAAFVQTGETAPMELVAKTGKTFRQMHYIMMGVGALVLLVLGALGYRAYRKKKA